MTASEKLRIDECNEAGIRDLYFPAEEGRRLSAWLLENDTALGRLPTTLRTGTRRAVRKAWSATRRIETAGNDRRKTAVPAMLDRETEIDPQEFTCLSD